MHEEPEEIDELIAVLSRLDELLGGEDGERIRRALKHGAAPAVVAQQLADGWSAVDIVDDAYSWACEAKEAERAEWERYGPPNTDEDYGYPGSDWWTDPESGEQRCG